MMWATGLLYVDGLVLRTSNRGEAIEHGTADSVVISTRSGYGCLQYVVLSKGCSTFVIVPCTRTVQGSTSYFVLTLWYLPDLPCRAVHSDLPTRWDPWSSAA